MSNYDFDSNPEGDWEDRGDLAWNEFDWQHYLRQNEQEVVRFLSLYQKLKSQPNHLDDIAHLMGWDLSDWSMLDDFEENSEEPAQESTAEVDLSPYTVHRHPVYIATHSIYQLLRILWEHLLANSDPQQLSGQLSWEFAKSVHAGELNALMAINALDVGDLALTVCHLKNALAALNHSLRIVQQIPTTACRDIPIFQREATTALFDLREIWLRVMNECREECNRDSGEPL